VIFDKVFIGQAKVSCHSGNLLFSDGNFSGPPATIATVLAVIEYSLRFHDFMVAFIAGFRY